MASHQNHSYALSILILIFFASVSSASEVKKGKLTQLYVRDYGVTPTSKNSYKALQRLLIKATKMHGPVEILFEPNVVYRISVPKGESKKTKYVLYLKNVSQLALNGRGATLLITNPENAGICTEDSHHVVVKNFVIDYESPPHAQGTITEVDRSDNWFDLRIDPDFLELSHPCFGKAKTKWGLTVRDEPDGGRRYGPTAIFAKRWEEIGNRFWRIYPSSKSKGNSGILKKSGLKVGDHYVHLARTYSQAVSAKNCHHLLWDNLTIHASPGIAFYPFRTLHHTIRNCHVKVKKGRLLSTNADGIHMRSSRGHVLIDGCSFEGMADDGINVHSSPMSVQSQPQPNQVVVKKSTFSVRPGDELMLVRSSSATILGTARVKTVQNQKGSLLIKLSQKFPQLFFGSGFGSSDNLYNLSEAANPFVIRNCHFNDYRGRGILISAYGGVIENNVFDLREGWSVVMNYESTRWAEGPIAYDVTIRNNKFHGHGTSSAAIQTYLVARGGATANARPYHDVRIVGNQFNEYGTSVIELNAAHDVAISDNRVFCSEEAVRKRPRYATIVLKNCENISVDGLVVEDRNPKQYAIVDIGKDCGSGESISVKGLAIQVAKTCEPIHDRR